MSITVNINNVEAGSRTETEEDESFLSLLQMTIKNLLIRKQIQDSLKTQYIILSNRPKYDIEVTLVDINSKTFINSILTLINIQYQWRISKNIYTLIVVCIGGMNVSQYVKELSQKNWDANKMSNKNKTYNYFIFNNIKISLILYL